MKSFESVLLRLKAELKIQTDKEVGALLGLQEKAFNARKRRDSFPEDKLRALAQQRPDLNIDVDYVLTGVSPDLGKTMAAYAGSADGEQLLAEVTLGHVPGKVSPEPSVAPGEVVALPASSSGSLTWRQVLIVVIDQMSALKMRMPGATLVGLVDLLMLLQKEGRPLNSDVVSSHLKLVGKA